MESHSHGAAAETEPEQPESRLKPNLKLRNGHWQELSHICKNKRTRSLVTVFRILYVYGVRAVYLLGNSPIRVSLSRGDEEMLTLMLHR
jgi:hypothetical protein